MKNKDFFWGLNMTLIGLLSELMLFWFYERIATQYVVTPLDRTKLKVLVIFELVLDQLSLLVSPLNSSPCTVEK